MIEFKYHSGFHRVMGHELAIMQDLHHRNYKDSVKLHRYLRRFLKGKAVTHEKN